MAAGILWLAQLPPPAGRLYNGLKSSPITCGSIGPMRARDG